MGKLFFLGLVTIIHCAKAAELFHHDIQRYPAPGRCAAAAIELADKFKHVAGVEIYWAGATGESSSGCDLKISYLAEKEVPLTNNLDRSGLGAADRGTTGSLADCEKDLAREVEIFQKSTGLESWVSFCASESSFLNKLPYYPVIEGIGQSGTKFFSGDAIMTVSPNQGWEPVFAQIEANASKLGVNVASLVARPHISAPNKKLTLRYYAKERGYFKYEGVAPHRDPAICDEQVAEVGSALANASKPPLAVYCGKYFGSEYKLAIVTLYPDVLSPDLIKVTLDPKQYESLPSCRAQIESTLDFYRDQLGKKVLAGICADGQGSFQITVLHEAKMAPPR